MSDYDPKFIPIKHYAIVGQKVVIGSGNKILILKRSDKAGGGGLWSLPGGGLDTGEEPYGSIKREINEETGLTVNDLRPFTLISEMEGKDFIVIIGYKAVSASEKVKLNWEHTDYKWSTKEAALNEKLSNNARSIIKKIR